jgi:hypothetical protein
MKCEESMEQTKQFPASNQSATSNAIASDKRAPDLAPIGSGAGVHHADGCGDEQLQGEGVTAW